MFELYANKSILALRQKEPIVSGAVNVVYLRFAFSKNWDGLEKTVVFRAGQKTVSLLLEQDICPIPWEVLETSGVTLSVGVYGNQNGVQVLPTIWASLGVVQEGAKPGEDSHPPTPDLWEQQLAAKQDKLKGKPGQVVGFDINGKAVAMDVSVAGQQSPIEYGPQDPMAVSEGVVRFSGIVRTPYSRPFTNVEFSPLELVEGVVNYADD